MHRALEVNEILDNVFQHLDKRCQGRALRVCRLWFPPAARCLWHSGAEQGFIHLIWLCIHVVIMSKTFDDLRAYDEWRRFQLYSSLIRSLELTTYTTAGAVGKFLGKMVIYSDEISTAPLFPHLRSLKVVPFSGMDLAWVQLLLCPSLVSFEFRAYDFNNREPQSSTLLAFLGSLWKHAPALTHAVFGINDIATHGDYTRQVDETLRFTQAKLEHLRSLGCTSSFAFGHIGLESLAHLPRLSELTISGNRELVKGDEFKSLSASVALCPNLLRIHFVMVNLAEAAHFLERLPGTLQEIEVQSIETNKDAITRFVRACARFKLLRRFKLIQRHMTFLDTLLFQNDMLGYDTTTTLHLEWFSPLAECAEMKVFQILLGGWRVSCTVDDDQLACFTESWPEIEKFELRPTVLRTLGQRYNEETSGLPFTITQQSLLSFASHCRKLRSLRLPWLHVHSFDNDRVPDPGLALVDLSFQLGVGDISVVQNLLSRMWPNATVVWNLQHALMSTSGVEYEQEEEEEDEGADEYNFVEEPGEDYNGDMYEEFVEHE